MTELFLHDAVYRCMKSLLKTTSILILLLFSISVSAQEKEIDQIKTKIAAFSEAYINANYDALANSYTTDARILPNGTRIIEGREAIKERWILPENTKILKHVVTPEEIKVIGEYAYDVGYYEGSTQTPNGEVSNWKGKYLIVWKKVDGDWLIHIDAWNRVNQ